MESSDDKQWASKYLLDPLTAPEPSDETGPGAHFRSTIPDSSKGPSVHSRSVSNASNGKGHTRSSSSTKSPSATVYPTPPASASPTQSSFHPSNPFSTGHRSAAFSGYNNAGPSRRSVDEPSNNGTGRRRGSSLNERFPGDMSHRPLDQLRKEAKAANRSPHLKKKHLPGADSIDVLDQALGGAYHHEGPYDATLLARNTSYTSSPVEAVRGSNEEAIKATPREHIKDSLTKHVPLQGTSVVPPGMAGLDGRTMDYEEGADLMRESEAGGGAYKRWPGVQYHPDDLKGKGEPSYSIEKALKDHDRQHAHRRIVSEGAGAYEMTTPRNRHRDRPETTRQRSQSGSLAQPSGSTSGNAMRYAQYESEMRRSSSTGKKVSEGLKRRFGSLRLGKKSGAEV